MASEHCKACEEDYFAAEEAAEVALHALECAESERARERQEEARAAEREVLRNREWDRWQQLAAQQRRPTEIWSSLSSTRAS